jgi:hypothetical protein
MLEERDCFGGVDDAFFDIKYVHDSYAGYTRALVCASAY